MLEGWGGVGGLKRGQVAMYDLNINMYVLFGGVIEDLVNIIIGFFGFHYRL